MVYETKITSRNLFIENPFELENDKHSENDKRPPSKTVRGFWTFLLTIRPRMLHVWGFID